jgi:hypothetical protein
MQTIYSENVNKNIFSVQVRKDEPAITIRSNFDSGNIAKVEMGLNNSIILSPSNDCAGT